MHKEIYADREAGAIPIGFVGENDTLSVIFDLTPFRQVIGEGTPTLQVQRKGDKAPYPVALTVEGDVARWTVRREDVQKPGEGMCQLTYINGEQVGKTQRYRIFVHKSLGTSGPVPPPYQDFADKVAEDAVKAEQAAKRAEDAAGSIGPGGGGTADHTKLTNRDQPNQHPIGAITGLSDALAEVPTKTSQLENDSGYLTEHQSLTDYAKKTEVPTKVGQLENDAKFVAADKTIQVLEPVTSLEDAETRDLWNIDELPFNTRVLYNFVPQFSGQLSGKFPSGIKQGEFGNVRHIVIDTVGTCFGPGYGAKACQFFYAVDHAGAERNYLYFREFQYTGQPFEWVDLTDKLTQSDLQGGIDKALAQAKASKQFDGADGFSPTVAVNPTETGHTVTVTDKDGPKQFQVENGKPGKDGTTPALSIGKVDTLAPESPATAEITGPVENLKLNLGIPQGKQGEGGGGSGSTSKPVKLVSMESDGVSTAFVEDLTFEDGAKYAALLHMPAVADDANPGSTIFMRIGDVGIFGNGFRAGHVTTQKAQGLLLHGYVSVIFITQNGEIRALAKQNNGKGSYSDKDGFAAKIVKNKVTMYSQTSKPIMAGITMEVWKL